MTKNAYLNTDVQYTPMDGTSLLDPTFDRQLVGILIYLAITPLDIAYGIHSICQFMAFHLFTFYVVVLHILSYANGTLFHGLQFSSYLFLELWVGDPTYRQPSIGICNSLGDSINLMEKNACQHCDLALKMNTLSLLTLLFRCFRFIGSSRT